MGDSVWRRLPAQFHVASQFFLLLNNPLPPASSPGVSLTGAQGTGKDDGSSEQPICSAPKWAFSLPRCPLGGRLEPAWDPTIFPTADQP